MIRLSREAEAQLDDLLNHYRRRGRPEASRNLIAAIDSAMVNIAAQPEKGLAAPRAYPALARPDRAWRKSGSYWLAYSLTNPPIILAIFHETADIPRRLDRP